MPDAPAASPDQEHLRSLRRSQVPFSTWLATARQYADDDPAFDADVLDAVGDPVLPQRQSVDWANAYRAELTPVEAVDGARAAAAFNEAADAEAQADAEEAAAPADAPDTAPEPEADADPTDIPDEDRSPFDPESPRPVK